MRWFCLFILFVLLHSASSYIYSEEVGKIDWYKENIGKITKVFFQNQGDRKTLYVSSSANVLATLDQRTGEIIWRRVLDQKLEDLFRIENPDFSYLLSVTWSGNSTFLSAWDIRGELLWQQPHSSKGDQAVIAVGLNEDADGDGTNDLFLLSSTTVQVRSARDGKIIWTKDCSESETYVGAWRNKGGIDTVVTSSQGAEVRVVTTGKGEVVSTHSISKSPVENFVESGTHFVTLQGSTLFVYNKVARKTTSHELAELGITAGRVLSKSLRNSFLIQGDGFTQVVQIGDKLTVAHKFQSSCFVSSTEDGNHIISFCGNEGSLYDLQGAPRALKITAPGVISAFGKVSASHSAILVVKNDWETQFMETTSGNTWSREESLSAIGQVQFVHLPSKHSISTLQHTKDKLDHESGLSSQFLTTLSSQVDLLKEWLSFGVEEKSAGELTPKEYKDPFGFRQLILAVTIPGTILGIDSQTSHTVWKQFVPNSCDTVTSQQLLFTRTVAHYPPHAYLIQQCDNAVRVHSIEPLSGKIERDVEVLHTGLKQAVVLPIQDAEGNFLAILHTNGDSIHLLPSSEAARAAFRNKLTSVYLHYYDSDARVLTGFSVRDSTSNVFELNPIWAFSLMSGGLKPTEVDIATSGQHIVYSPLKILHDSSALEKYLNPHLLAIVATYPFSGQTSEHAKIFLIDGITGNMIHSNVISAASGNVGIVQSENNIFYYYWSTKHVRVETGVIELYHKSIDWSRTEFSSFVESQCCNVTVFHQNFVFGHLIKTVGVTKTLQEIAPKQILVGMFSGQVVGLPKSILDARRPPKPAPGAATPPVEAGVIPYDPYVAINPKAIINYFNKVEQLREIVTAPSYLESTSLVIAYGLDVFFTRTAPASGFDIINSDFNYQALLLTTITLFIFTIASSQIAKRQDLIRKWK